MTDPIRRSHWKTWVTAVAGARLPVRRTRRHCVGLDEYGNNDPTLPLCSANRRPTRCGRTTRSRPRQVCRPEIMFNPATHAMPGRCCARTWDRDRPLPPTSTAAHRGPAKRHRHPARRHVPRRRTQSSPLSGHGHPEAPWKSRRTTSTTRRHAVCAE